MQTPCACRGLEEVRNEIRFPNARMCKFMHFLPQTPLNFFPIFASIQVQCYRQRCFSLVCDTLGLEY